MPFPTDPEAILALIFSILSPLFLSLPFFDGFGSRAKTILNTVFSMVIYGAAGFFWFKGVDPGELFAWALAAAGLASANYAIVTPIKRKLVGPPKIRG